MEKRTDDVNTENLSSDQIDEMEERRITAMNEAGIDEQEILHNAKEDQKTWMSFFNENIVRGKDDVNFCVRDQWTAVERSEFTRMFTPAMTRNKLLPEITKIVGEQRKNKPDIIVRSLTGRASQDQIDLRADLIRTTAYHSQTDLVYQTAFRSALMRGFGAFQVVLDYRSPRSRQKIARYDLITDPTLCSWDPTAVKPHKGDGNYCGRSFIMTRDEFFATFPYVTNPVSFIDPYMLLDMQYLNRDTIIVHDSFRKEWYPLEIVYLSNGMDVTEAQWEEAQKAHQEQLEITEGSIVSEIIKNGIPRVVGGRQTQDYEIMHYRMTRDQIIDFSKWPSRQLPIPFVDGNSDYIEGRQYTKSYIHEARDSQKLHNYAMSQLAGDLKNRRREQWMGTPDNIKGNEQMWRNPEVQMGILTAIPDPKSGLMPQKTPASEVPQGLFMTGQATAQDIHEILGVSTSEELGSRDVSGKSRRERKMEVSASTYVWFDNMNQAIEQGARVYSDLLPHIIGDEEMRMMRTRKDGRSESITLNSRDKDGKVVNSIGEGDFDVEIDTGPSFAVQKDVALEFLAQTIQAYPQSFPLVADLWAKNLDVQFGPQIADRFKTLVPPQILAKEEGKPPPPPQPDPQAQMMQAEMQLKQSQMQAKMKEVQIKEQELQLKMQQLELDKQKMMLEAQKDAMDSQLDVFNHKADLEEVKLRHHLDSTKADNDFALGLAGHLTDLHKHHHPVESKKAE